MRCCALFLAMMAVPLEALAAEAAERINLISSWVGITALLIFISTFRRSYLKEL